MTEKSTDNQGPTTPAQQLGRGIKEPLPKWGVVSLVIINYLMQLLVLAVEIVWVIVMLTSIVLYGFNNQLLAVVGLIVLVVVLWSLNRLWLSIFNHAIPRYRTVRSVRVDHKKAS